MSAALQAAAAAASAASSSSGAASAASAAGDGFLETFSKRHPSLSVVVFVGNPAL